MSVDEIANDFKMLARFAKTALAARSARRLRPLMRCEFESRDLSWLEGLIADAEFAAATRTRWKQTPTEIQKQENHLVTFDLARPSTLLHVHCCLTGSIRFPDHALDILWLVLRAPIKAFEILEIPDATSKHIRLKCAKAIHSDIKELLDAGQEQAWSDRTPVPPGFFGPLWRHGVPDQYPEIEAKVLQLPAGEGK
jgi:hypothetical protein